MRYDAIELNNVFEKGEVDQIFLNFSDPWPKSRHAKRRLTSREFLDVYRQLLIKDGLLNLKQIIVDCLNIHSICSVNHYHLDYVSLDLHNSPEGEGNIMTEYERKFSVNGPIYKLIVRDTMEKKWINLLKLKQ